MSRIILPPGFDLWGVAVVLSWNVRANVKMFKFQYFRVSLCTNVK